MNIQTNVQVLTELLIQNFASQRALQKIITEVLAKDDDHANAILEGLNNEIRVETDLILNDLYSRHGDIDWNNLFQKP